MKPHSIVCNGRRLVSVKFYLNRRRFTVVIAKCLGGSRFGHTVRYNFETIQ